MRNQYYLIRLVVDSDQHKHFEPFGLDSITLSGQRKVYVQQSSASLQV